jgi:zinc-binding in reverse transcriptase
LRLEKAEVHSIMVDLSMNFIGYDFCVWSLDTKGIFSVQSLYSFFMNGGCINYSMIYLWELKLPLKIRCFLWLVIQNKILIVDNWSRKRWVRSLTCVFCSINESVNHLFLICPFMFGFWEAFNTYNIYHIRLNLSSITDLWDSVVHLSSLARNLHYLSLEWFFGFDGMSGIG